MDDGFARSRTKFIVNYLIVSFYIWLNVSYFVFISGSDYSLERLPAGWTPRALFMVNDGSLMGKLLTGVKLG
jgi:hypothetical protein